VTVSFASPVIAAPDVESALDSLRRRGLRISAARRLVVEALFAAGRPVSAPEIAEGLGGDRPRLDQASVYANLQALEEVGLVSHVHLGHGPGRYALADRVECEYVECERCGRVEALKPSVLAEARAAIRAATGYVARFDHFPIVGTCASCAGSSEEDHRA